MASRHPQPRSGAETQIPLSVPHLGGREWDYVKECLDTNFVSAVGPFVDRFEQQIAAHLEARCAVATVNGTAALHIALLVAGVRPDDEVLVSAMTFIAPANAIRYVGAWPVFIDAEPHYWQMDPAGVADFLESRCERRGGEVCDKVTGRRVSAVLPVHILGHPVDLDPILDLARKYNLLVIEDATEGLGAEYKGRKVGHLADIACLSFNGNKIITSGGGGMLVTDNAHWAARAKHLTTQAKDDPVEYIHDSIGYNYRLVNVLAAVGCAQLEQLDACVAAKRRIAAAYNDAFAALPGLTPLRQAPWAGSTFWLYTILVDEPTFGMDSRALLRRLNDSGIQSRPLWQPLHMSTPHARSQAGGCRVAEDLWARALSLPCSVGLTPADQQRVVKTVTASQRAVARHRRPARGAGEGSVRNSLVGCTDHFA
ncbi:MAG TPA: LegC family aminotransferase [Phycisphaerae bacterium]|nr:LegC family aminotransferase [Phycisphaerae bacterium]